MAALPIKTIITYSDGSYKLENISQKTYYRIPHDIERYNYDFGDLRYAGARIGVVRAEIRNAGVARPEVYRVYPSQTTPIGYAHQWLWKNINPELSNDKFCTLLGNSLAWTNNTGFPGRRNYILNKDLNLQLPTFHTALVNGGMILEGEEDGDKVWIKSLLVSDPVPIATEVLNSKLWSWGTSVIPKDGSINYITRKSKLGEFIPVRILFLTKTVVWLPKDELHKLPNGFFPPPNWIVGDKI